MLIQMNVMSISRSARHVVTFLAVLAAHVTGCQATHSQGQHDHSGHQDLRFKDPEARAKQWNTPERDQWQKPREIVDPMAIEEGMTVADIGAGTGYFLPYLSQAVGTTGKVFAVDIERTMLDFIERSSREKGLTNIVTHQAEETRTGLERGSVDRILIVNTWHHIPARRDYAKHLFELVRSGGNVWVVDFLKDAPNGPPPEYRIPPEVVVDELEAGGFRAEVHPLALDRHYVVVGRR